MEQHWNINFVLWSTTFPYYS